MTRICGQNTLQATNTINQVEEAVEGRNVIKSQGRLHRGVDTGDRPENVEGKSEGGKDKEALRYFVQAIMGSSCPGSVKKGKSSPRVVLGYKALK